jgi:hypothetical protein
MMYGKKTTAAAGMTAGKAPAKKIMFKACASCKSPAKCKAAGKCLAKK